MSKTLIKIMPDDEGRYTVGFDNNVNISGFKKADLIPWSALLISIISLIFTIFQGLESREHDRLSMTPSLAISRFGRTDPVFGVLIENNGVGPGIIRNVQARVQNEYTNDIEEIRNKLCKKFNICKDNLSVVEDSVKIGDKVVYTSFSNGKFFSANAKLNIIEISGLSSTERTEMWQFISSEDEFEMRIEYCSVYDICQFVCLHRSGDECSSTVLHK